jgi:hypothetical protein
MNTTETEIGQLCSDIQKLRGDIEALGATIGRVAKASIRETRENTCGTKRGLGMDVRASAERTTQTIEENPIATAQAAPRRWHVPRPGLPRPP